MSSTETIEMSMDAAREFLPFLEDKLQRLVGELTSLQSDYDRTKTTVAELRAKLNGKATNGIDAPRQRMRKGEAENIIADLLSALPDGHSLSMQDIATKTSIAYSSVFRVLKTRGKGKFVESGGHWKLVKK